MPIVAKLRDGLASIIREREFVARIEQDGGCVLDVPPADQAKFLRDESERWIKMVQQYGVTVE